MTRRTRLLVTTSDLIGRGSERELSNLLRWLPRDRFEISLCLWRKVLEYPIPPDIPVTFLHKTRPWHIFRTIHRLKQHLDEVKPDVVFSQLNYVNTATGSAIGRMKSPPAWLARFAGNPEVEIRWPVLPWTRRSLQRAALVAGCSRAVAAAVERHLGVPRGRTISLDNIVDVDEIDRASRQEPAIARPTGRKLVVSVGGLVDQKDHDTLIRALAELGRSDVELWILGKGPNERQLERLTRSLGLGDRVRLTGFQSNPHAIVRQADLFVLSSRYEGLPNALLEAMIVGTPVVSTDCPYGPADLIELGRTGWLTPVGDVGALARGIEEALGWPEEARRRAERAKQEVCRRFDPANVVEQYASAFESLARRRSG